MYLATVWFWNCITLSWTMHLLSAQVTSAPAEALLVRDLLTGYSTAMNISHGAAGFVRPRMNSSHDVKVQLGLRLITLDVDEKLQMLTASVWLRMRWYDDFLTWNPDDYGGIKNIVLPYKSIWMPENIVLVNTAEAERDELPVDLQVKYTGRVFYAPHRVLKAGCLIDVTNYPFDCHTCDLWLQSASRYSSQMDLQVYYKEPMDLSTYLDSFKDAVEWEVVHNSSSRHDKPRASGTILMYSRRVAIKFSLGLRRRLGFTAVILMIPCVFLSLLTTVVFCLPPERPDRHMLAMSLFASLMVMLLILMENAPPSAAAVPQLGVYYVYNMFMVLAAIFCSVLVVAISRRGESGRRPQLMVQMVVRFLAPIVCSEARSALIFTKPDGNKQESSVSDSNKEISSSRDIMTPRAFPGPSDANLAYVATRIPTKQYTSNDVQDTDVMQSLDDTEIEMLQGETDRPKRGKTRFTKHLCSLCLGNKGTNGDCECPIESCDSPKRGQNRFTKHLCSLCLGNKGRSDDCECAVESCGQPAAGSGHDVRMSRRQWKAVAHVMDRSFALLFLIVNTIAIAAFFPRPT